MFKPWALLREQRAPVGQDELELLYGNDIIVSRVPPFNLIHMDNPSPEKVRRRVEEFDPATFFEDDCPICRAMRKQGGDIIYDDRVFGPEDPSQGLS